MRRGTAEGIILKLSDSGEADCILWMLTPVFGIMRAFARSGRKSVKRFGGRLLLFNRLKFDYSRIREGQSAAIESANLIEAFPELFSDETRFGRCALFAEVLLQAWGEGDPAPQAYEFYLEYLRRSEAHKETADRHVLDAFRLLEILGHRPVFDRCASCGGALEKSDMFSVNEGGTVCVNCAKNEINNMAGQGGTRPFKVSSAVRRTIEQSYNTDSKRLHRVRFTPKFRAETEKLWVTIIQAILGRTLKCIDYLAKIEKQQLKNK